MAEAKTPDVTYDVTYIDDVNDGVYVVWATEEDVIMTESLARGFAAKKSAESQFKTARVWKVTREIVAEYENGEETGKLETPTDAAEKAITDALVNYVTAGTSSARQFFRSDYYLSRASFVETYGERSWKKLYASIVKKHGLDEYIFDTAQLRDGK